MTMARWKNRDEFKGRVKHWADKLDAKVNWLALRPMKNKWFIGIVIAIFGLLGILTTFGTGAIIGLAALLLTFILVIVSIVLLFRIRKRVTSLRWWQRIVWIVGATLVAVLALILEAIVYPSGTLTNYFTGSIFLLLGLVIVGISIR